MIIAATQQPETTEERRAVVCDSYDAGCGKIFAVPLSEYQPGGSHLCGDCTAKRDKLKLLRTQLVMARQFGHTENGCELCAIQNQIDDVLTSGYDWREEYDRKIEALMRPSERRAGGAVY